MTTTACARCDGDTDAPHVELSSARDVPALPDLAATVTTPPAEPCRYGRDWCANGLDEHHPCNTASRAISVPGHAGPHELLDAQIEDDGHGPQLVIAADGNDYTPISDQQALALCDDLERHAVAVRRLIGKRQQLESAAATTVQRIVFIRAERPQAEPVIATRDADSRTLHLTLCPDHSSAGMVELLNGTAQDVPAALLGTTIDLVDRLPVDVPVVGWSPEDHRLLVDERHLSVQAAAALSAELGNPHILPAGPRPDAVETADAAVDGNVANAGAVSVEGPATTLLLPDGTTLSASELWWPAEEGAPELRQFILDSTASFPMDVTFEQFAALPDALRRFADELEQQYANAGQIGGGA